MVDFPQVSDQAHLKTSTWILKPVKHKVKLGEAHKPKVLLPNDQEDFDNMSDEEKTL